MTTLGAPPHCMLARAAAWPHSASCSCCTHSTTGTPPVGASSAGGAGVDKTAIAAMQTPDAAAAPVWITPEKDAAVLSPRVSSRGQCPQKKWASSSVPLLSSTIRLLERSMSGVCPAADPEAVFAPLFHSVTVPEISPSAYLEGWLLTMGLLHKEHLLEPMLLHMIIYIDRLLKRHAVYGFHLCASNAHRLLLVSAVLSSKVVDDESYNSRYWASVGGVSAIHLTELELYACRALGWELFISIEELRSTKATLLSM